MAHDGQDMTLQSPILLDGLLDLTRRGDCTGRDGVRDRKGTCARQVSRGWARFGPAGRDASDRGARAGMARHLCWKRCGRCRNGPRRCSQNGKFGEIEQLIHQIAFGEYLWQIYGGIQMNQGEIVRLQDHGPGHRTTCAR